MLGQSQEWNLLEHQLANSRQASMEDGGRAARMTAWQTATTDCVSAAAHTKANLQEISDISPDSFVLFWSEAENQIKVGWVASIFRGAVLSNKKKNSRRMRCTKPYPTALPLHQCARVRLVVCKRASNHSWVATPASHVVP